MKHSYLSVEMSTERYANFENYLIMSIYIGRAENYEKNETVIPSVNQFNFNDGSVWMYV